ncbi:MAG: MBL fold metallo-hydrolase [Patescibacteria group bacterium]
MEIHRIQSWPRELAQNCWVLREKNLATVIDPGCENAGQILDVLQNRAKIAAILLTHHHSDHTRALADLVGQTEAPIFIHSDDAEIVENGWLALKKISKPEKPIRLATQPIRDRQILKFGDLQIEVIATPGHTLGSVCFLVGNHLFSGDTLFRENVGRTDLFGGNKNDLQKNLTRLLELPKETIVHPGHGDDWTIGAAREFFEKNRAFFI